MSDEQLISTLIQRLEKVTSRLEHLEKQVGTGSPSASTSKAADGPSVAFVSEYEDLINQFVRPYVESANKLGDKVVSEQAGLFLQVVEAQRDFLKVAASSKKPADNVFQQLIKPTSELMTKLGSYPDANRTSKFINNLFAVSEGTPALGWVTVSPTPGPFVGDMRGSSEFYSNRILKDFKGKDQQQVDFVTHFNGFLKELQNYVKKHHTTGLTWNPKGGDATAPTSTTTSTTSTPTPAKPAVSTPATGDAPKPAMGGLLSALNKGGDVTTGLKKVTSDMKTKNRTDNVAVVPATGAKKTGSGPKFNPPPAKFALEGNKWKVEGQIDNQSIVIDNTESKQTIYIYRCHNSVINIKGKVNSIAFDECSKTGVVFDNAIATFEVVNCDSVQVQVTGSVPSISIDKTSGCQIFLSENAKGVEIVSSKSDEMNVMFPGPDKEMVELAIPEQFKTSVKGSKLETKAVEHV